MTRKIFSSIFAVATAVLVLSFSIITAVLYNQFSTVQKAQLEAELGFVKLPETEDKK